MKQGQRRRRLNKLGEIYFKCTDEELAELKEEYSGGTLIQEELIYPPEKPTE